MSLKPVIPAKAGIQIGLTRLNLSLRAQRGNLVARARNFIDSNTGASKKFPFASLRLRAFALNFLAITQPRNSYQDRTYALEPVIASALNLSLRAQRGNLVA